MQFYLLEMSMNKEMLEWKAGGTVGLNCFKWCAIFDCCKPALPSIHPSTHPSIRDQTFSQKRSVCQITVHICSYFVQIPRQVRTVFLLAQNFQLLTFRTQMLKLLNFKIYLIAKFTILLWLFSFFLKTKFIIFLRIDPH